MKISYKPTILAAGGICVIVALFVICGCFCAPKEVADAGVCDLLTPEIVKFYEEEIAKERVLSSKSEQNVKAIANRFGIDEQKAKCAILLFDFSKRTGGGITFPEIANMNEFKMLAFAKQRGEIYGQTLNKEDKEELKKKASDLLGIRL